MTAQSWWGTPLLDRGDARAVWLRAAGHESTVGELRAQVAWLAEVFGSYGIRAGDTVALHGTVSFTQVWALFALWSLDAQVLLFEPGAGPGERAALLELCAPRFLVTFGESRGMTDVFVAECEVLVRRLPRGRRARSGHALVQFSSGTMGRSKPVGRTARSLLAELGRLRGLDGGPAAGERVAVLESVTHSFGLIGGLLHTLDVGATAVLPAARTPRAYAGAARGAHVVIGNPGHFAALTAADTRADTRVTLPGLRLALSGGEALPREVAEAFLRRYGVRIGQVYGTTEAGVIATDLTGAHGPLSLGTPVPGVATRAVGGVLEVYLPQWPYPYEDEPPPGGWISTHDLTTFDPATGALRLRGRAEGRAEGRSSGPAELDLLAIESVLRSHAQVTEAVVLGTGPVEAHVASAAALEQAELRAWCRRFLDDAAVPDRYHVVRELPRTSNGKILRSRTRLLEHMAGA
ncbi:class I adenylate-forming enzyme family protein [Streptomyces sp. UNOC14_S4]|uniref:class I adenylate-forming enzyme family protein n=1 Tax=Streptomyces sp. UNOC14_S4 TaxID=2872340 RepID=UPI001E435B92|nr:class I adenylate-forming enzyme family protein [Streptomyces sp. UNOC14_S4]MCC3769296.1 acyl--CoA ligase [Streptomyces sp. UNOC14_S4]